jgi:DNA-binding MarR family transcriptional regulator
LKSNTLTPVLKRLEKNGWITRQETADKRSNCLVLTKKGQQEKDGILTAVQSCIPLTTQADIALYEEALHVVKTINERLATIDHS